MNGVEAGGRSLSMAEVGSTLLAVAEKARIGLVINAVRDDGRIEALHASDAVREIVGRSREELVDRDLFDFIAIEDRRRAAELVRQVMAHETASQRIELAIVNGAGKRVPVEITFAKVTDRDRVFAVNLIVDITARKRREEQLARADRLAALGTMAARVAHEINNPLAFMTLNAETLTTLMTERISDGETRRELISLVAEIQSGTSRVGSAVDDLRSLSRSDQPDDEPVDLWKVIASAERLASHQAREAGRRVRFALEPSSIPKVDANAFRLEQVFVNLLSNAAQAFSRSTDDDLVRVHGGVLGPGAVFIEVEDNGDGIAPDVIGRIFDPFFTTRPVGVGAGLGLAVCHGIVSRLGGEITVRSAPGRGSTFRVVLPASRRTSPSSPAPPSAEATLARGRVLVVDDEETIGRSIKRLLQRDHDVDVETSGGAALERLLGETTYDVVLCDLMMAEISGMDVYEHLARERPGIERRVAFMTGGAVSPEARSFLERIPNIRLDKPFSVEVLKRTLRTVMNR